MTNDSAPGGAPDAFSRASIACQQVLPVRKLACSQTVGWTTLLVQTFQSPSWVEAFDTRASPDQLIVVTTKGQGECECFSGGRWRRETFHSGMGGMTPGGQSSRLRWRSPTPVEMLYIYLPPYYLAAAENEYRRAGTSFKTQPLNALAIDDPIVARVALSLADAVRTGAPNLYAESVAQFLAVHLLSLQSRWGHLRENERQPGILSDRRLTRVLDYIQAHYREAVSLEQLAREACISRFHFGRLFKERVGMTPHQYLVNVRLEAAATALREDRERTILDIALACGYHTPAHFAAAFRRHFRQSPSVYREAAQELAFWQPETKKAYSL